jgi:hypothetical protein
VQPFDFLSAGDATQRGIDDGDFHGTAADRFQRDIPRWGAGQHEAWRYSAAQSLVLKI